MPRRLSHVRPLPPTYCDTLALTIERNPVPERCLQSEVLPPSPRHGHGLLGQFRRVLAEKESHLLELARYIVLHSVRSKRVRSVEDRPVQIHESTSIRSDRDKRILQAVRVQHDTLQEVADPMGLHVSTTRVIARRQPLGP